MKRTTVTLMAAAGLLAGQLALSAQERPDGAGFSFTTAVDLVNVTVTVTDEEGRFVAGLRAEDFELYEDGRRQQVQQFESQRVAVSLGIALDTSGSMLGEKIAAAEAALNRFLFELLGPDDEVFLYRFDGRPSLVHDWTTDRRSLSRALGAVKPTGGTALYDTVAEAVPHAQRGTRRKKALVIISDGNDTSSRTAAPALSPIIRASEVLVYAIGIDASDGIGAPPAPERVHVPTPFPGRPPMPASPRRAPARPPASSIDRVNPAALRAITEESGGRTEIIVSPRELAPATAGIADELSRQYFLAYTSSLPRDGRWHTIDVRLPRHPDLLVRARRGFLAD